MKTMDVVSFICLAENIDREHLYEISVDRRLKLYSLYNNNQLVNNLVSLYEVGGISLREFEEEIEDVIEHLDIY